MTKRTNIILTGFMGTGKTTVSRMIAKKLNMDFVDMDTLIEQREQCKISEIFANQGESHFRALERALVQELAAGSNQVIGTGGGVVLNPDNIRDFEAGGIVICLVASPETILKRVSRHSHRPLLEDADKGNKIMQLLEKRHALYDAITHKIDTSSLVPGQVADMAIAIANENG